VKPGQLINSFYVYQRAAERTATEHESRELTLTILALGLCGEAGEVAELVKKSVGHGVPFDQSKIKKELGDVLWYLTQLAAAHGISLQEVATANVDKLRARYPQGFILGGGVR
jgi:NTP pyrophosphatase (non-canonical NTP hydrolase)